MWSITFHILDYILCLDIHCFIDIFASSKKIKQQQQTDLTCICQM